MLCQKNSKAPTVVVNDQTSLKKKELEKLIVIYFPPYHSSLSGFQPPSSVKMGTRSLAGRPPTHPIRNRLFQALYDFRSNSKGQLNFKRDDVIVVLRTNDHWMEGYLEKDLSKTKGIFPKSYAVSMM